MSEESEGEHWYGGPWTEIKLDAISYYLECYTTALTRVGFDLWYADAFAGTGSRQSTAQRGGIFEGQPLHVVTETLDGSARRALAVRPPFHHFVFNETDPVRNAALRRIKAEYPDLDIRVLDDDANEMIQNVFGAPPWTGSSRKGSRAVVFLDPYALQVHWSTLAMLAGTEAVDVWYLFPLRDVTRQLARKRSGIGPKEGRLDQVLSEKWRELYSLPPAEEQWQQQRLFDDQITPEEERNSSQKQIESWFKHRLESIFAYASEPLPLLTGQSRQAFSLFLCVANKSQKAIDLAKHFHSYVMKNFGPAASRQKFAP